MGVEPVDGLGATADGLPSTTRQPSHGRAQGPGSESARRGLRPRADPGERARPGVDASERARAPSPASPRPQAGGRHVLADFWTDDARPLRRVETWEALLPAACRDAGATVLGARFHQFAPDGVTGIVLLAESHASVHTWPEAGLATLDVFTCGRLDAEAVVQCIRAALRPVREQVTVVHRGDVSPSVRPPVEPDGV